MKQVIDVCEKCGTQKGLGELRNGPLHDMILDDLGDIDIPQKPIFVLKAKGWK